MRKTISIVFFFSWLITLPVIAQTLSVANLTIEGKENPGGVELSSPAMSWQLISSRRNVMQTAYRILVADDIRLLEKDSGNIWDSEKIPSAQSVRIKYSGKTLKAVKTYYWKVRTWDNSGYVSDWSSTATWQMGLLTEEDWKQARWIGYEKIPDSLIAILPLDGKRDSYRGNNILPLFRKAFVLNKAVRKATLFISGLGQFEASINGKKVGDHFLDPGWTKYDQQALYVSFDVTAGIHSGENVIGVMLGNGFYYIPPVPGRYRKLRGTFGFPKLICRLAVEFIDGTVSDIVTDGSWMTAKSPVVFSSIYGGEDYDATLEQAGWDQPGFDASTWRSALVVDGSPILNSQAAEPVKVMEAFSPRRLIKLDKSTWVYDMGQNASGIPQIKLRGKKGDVVRIVPGELLRASDSVNQRASGGPYYFEYTLRGGGIETWAPRFTYYGYRYLQVEGAVPEDSTDMASLPAIIEINSLHIRNAAEKTGRFSCSNDLFNKTYELVDWAVKSNMVSVFTDCPHREKLGWLEQLHLMYASVMYNYDALNLFRKQILDMRYSQTEQGLVPEIAPEYVKFDWGNGMFRDSPEWGSSSIIVPWYLYQWYGDEDILKDNYGMMTQYASYLSGQAKGHLLFQGLGDWYDLGPKAPGVSQLTPMGITGSAIYYYDLTILSEVAGLLKKNEEVSVYARMAQQVKKAFNDSFYNAQTRQYGTGSQTANAMAVYFDLVEQKDRQAVIDNLIKDIKNRGNSLTAGDIGYRYLLCVLHEAGRDDVIFDMNNRTDVPGYGLQIIKGATALTESWSALSTNSNNHLMLGHIMEWYYRGLLGIELPESPLGFKQITIHPNPVGDVEWAKGAMQTPYGWIASEWKDSRKKFTLNVQVPANTVAIVRLPLGKSVKEGHFLFKKRWDKGKAGRYDPAKGEVHVGSGKYSFQIKKKR